MSFDKDAYELEHGSRRNPPANPSFKLKASVQTYELSVPDIQKLFARELGVPEDRITITAKQRDASHPMDQHSNYVFDGLTITVKNA